MARRRQQFNASLSSYSGNGPQPEANGDNAVNQSSAPHPVNNNNTRRFDGNQRQRPPHMLHGNVKTTVSSHPIQSSPSDTSTPVAQILVPKDPNATEEQEAHAYAPLAENAEGKEAAQLSGDEVDTDDTCFICAEKIKYWATGVCGHQTCHVCAIRLRVFYKKKDCTFCKTSLPTLLFSSTPETTFPTQQPPVGSDLEVGELDVKDYQWVDAKLGVIFESEQMMEDVLLLLRFNCPSPSCGYQASSWDSLEKHTLSVHQAVLCHLCRKQLSRFAHEQVLYPPHLLACHDPSRIPRGHRRPKIRNEKEEEMVAGWGPPHPMCEFCHEAFFSSDELLKHMRVKHEECFVCKEKGMRDVYFQNYKGLADHFGHAHFPCTEQSCLERKFVVFGSELDWKAHMVAEHNKTMSARDKYQARQLPVDFVASSSLGGDYSFIPPNPMPNREQGSSRGPRHVQMEPVGQFSRQTGRNRVGAVQHQQLPQPPRDDRHNRRAGFGNALTTDETSNGNNKGNSKNGTSTPRIDEAEEMSAMQTELLERVATMVEYSETKLSSFRHAIRSYKHNEAPARDLVDTVYSVLNRDTEDTYKVVRRIADTMKEDDDKVQGILTALNSFRIDRQNEFPTLGGPAAPAISVGAGYSGIASGRVINAKSVTRTAGSASQVWDRVERAATSVPASKPKPAATTNSRGQAVPGAAFPALASTSTIKAASRPVNASAGWAAVSAGGSGSSIAQPVIRSVHMPAVSSKKVGRAPAPPSAASFPSLPTSTVTKNRPANFARDDMVRRMRGDAPPPPPAGWQSSSGITMDDYQEDARTEPEGKKKKKGKDVLFTLGQARNA